MKRHILQLLLIGIIAGSNAAAQINCSNGPTRQPLVCAFPFSTGSLANATALGTGIQGSSNGAQVVATGLNTAAATQVSQLPLAAASAGSVVTFKSGPNGPVPVVINDLGPILTDRAQTVGEHRLFLGFTASQFVFTDIDGNGLSNLKWSYLRSAFDSNHNLQSNTYTQEDVILSFRINQFVSVATFGVTKKLDGTIVIPVDRISVNSTTTNIKNTVLDPNNNVVFTYTGAPIRAAGTASGIGDVVLNLKYKVQEWERDAIAISGNLRMPSGDAFNFLGSNSWGLNPVLLYSHAGKFSPHMKVGYQWNTPSQLNNPSNAFRGKQTLPGGLQYNVGFDYGRKRFTFVADLLGNQFQNVTKLVKQQVILANNLTLDTTTTVSSTYTISNLSTGVKWGPKGGLVFSANLLSQINNVGLRSRPTPMLGIAYRF